MASARSGLALGQIQRLLDEGTLTGLTDAQLVDLFLERRDEGAFTALVARHGSMVLAVCRGVLKDQSDAEDAFQATFLVLFRKAGGLRSAGSLGSWLYRVAYRIAIRANAVAARRRERPIEEVTMAIEARPPGGAEIDREFLPIIYAEIDRLPDRYRAPIALCCLQGLSYEQAAHQLGWPLGTVGSRITRARELLRSRLSRRGVTATTAALSVRLAREATAAPPGWVEAVTRAAMRPEKTAWGAKAAGTVSAAVTLSDHVVRRMHMIRLIQTSSALAAATAGLIAWASLGDGGGPKPIAPANHAQTKRVEGHQDIAAGRGPISGRVLTPDGRPVRDAAIYVRWWRTFWPIDPIARTDADGRFRFTPEDISRLRLPEEAAPFDWKMLEVTAIIPGYGAARAHSANTDGSDLELRLVPDDVPIRGRVLDLQGRPVAGVIVQIEAIVDPPAGDLDAQLKSGLVERAWWPSGRDVAWQTKQGTNFETVSKMSETPEKRGMSGRTADFWNSVLARTTIRTGHDGTFRIEGAGRDRLVFMRFEGPGIGKENLCAMTRVAPASTRPRPVPAHPHHDPSQVLPLNGATFDYVASPSRTIEGVVRAKDTGRPLTGVRVSGSARENRETRGGAEAITDREGRFRLEGLPKSASYTVSASLWLPSIETFDDHTPNWERLNLNLPYLPASADVSDTAGLVPIPVTLDLPKGVSVRARLIDTATGKPVAGSWVLYIKMPSNPNEGDAEHMACHFRPDGFPMAVPPGPGLFYAQVDGKDLPYTPARLRPADRGKGVELFQDLLSHVHAYRIVDVPAGADNFPIDLELTRGTSRTGRLVDPDGKPVVQALVHGLSSNVVVKTLDDTSFEVMGLEPGESRTISFMHKDRRLAAAVAVDPGERPLEVRLAPCGSAIGRVVDQNGRPMAGAEITLELRRRRGKQTALDIGLRHSGLWPSGETFTADEQGRFRVEGINPDLAVQLRVGPSRSRPDFSLVPEKVKGAAIEYLEVKPGETVDLGEIRMTRKPNE